MNFVINNEGKNIHNLAKEIFFINRSITGKGVRDTLKIIKKILPKLNLYEIKSGSKVFDWTIPLEWNVSDAYLISPQGQKILDFKKNNLHLVGYSIPINQTVSFDKLKKHLHFKKDFPDAIPYVTSYYKKNWGFCISYKEYKKLKKGNYKVVIKSSLKKGSLTYADLLIKGKSRKEILLTSYTCHPSMANNEVSGICLLTYLAKYLSKQKKLRYSYRIVFHPETIGAITYISKNFKKLKQTIAGYVLSCVGDNKDFSLVKSKTDDCLSNRVAENILKNSYPNFKKYEFIESGSDERRYCGPNINLPVASVLRTKYGCYKEYHTSKDDLNFISPKGFQGSYEVYIKIISVIEKNYFYRLKTKCEPNLGKRDLYPIISKWPDLKAEKKIYNLMHFILYADGKLDLVQIAEKLNISAYELINVVDSLTNKKLLQKKSVNL